MVSWDAKPWFPRHLLCIQKFTQLWEDCYLLQTKNLMVFFARIFPLSSRTISNHLLSISSQYVKYWSAVCSNPTSNSSFHPLFPILEIVTPCTTSIQNPPKSFFFLAVLEFELGPSKLSKHVLYCLSHASTTFCSGYFGARFSLFPQACLEQGSSPSQTPA
jgi:hypothetical protein